MTKELKEALDMEMDAAMGSHDQERINVAQIHYNKAMCDCQYKTAQRVKDIATAMPPMAEDIKSIKDTLENGKKQFYKVAVTALKWIVIGGGGTEFVRFLMEK